MIAKRSFRVFIKVILYLFAFTFLLINFIIYNYSYKLTFPVTDESIKPKPKLTRSEKIKSIFYGVNLYKSKVYRVPDVEYLKVRLETGSGLLISSWLIKSTTQSNKSVILIPGFRKSKSSLLSQAKVLNELGYNCFLVDLRANGESQGLKYTFGIDESEEVYMAYKYIDSVFNHGPIVLWGESMGAYAVLRSVTIYNLTPDKVVLEKPLNDFRKTIANGIRYYHPESGKFAEGVSYLFAFWTSWHIGHSVFNEASSDYCASLNCPVLLGWGSRDELIDKQQILDIHSNIQSADKQLAIYTNSAHGMAFSYTDSAAWTNNVKHFLSY